MDIGNEMCSHMILQRPIAMVVRSALDQRPSDLSSPALIFTGSAVRCPLGDVDSSTARFSMAVEDRRCRRCTSRPRQHHEGQVCAAGHSTTAGERWRRGWTLEY
jgi:hypothetical protein